MAIEFNVESQVKTYATLSAFPSIGAVKTIYIALDTKLMYVYDSGAYTSIGDATSAEWGHINGDIASQVDLQTALNDKFNNPTGDSTQYLDGAGTPTTFPAFASADKMVTIGRNATGSTLYKGTIVYINGSTGNRPNFVKSQANGESTSAGTFGVIEADIPNNSDGNCVTIGTISNLDTRSNAPHPFTSDTLADGDTIYLSPTTAGFITNVKPSAPNHLVYLGKVVRTSPTNGTIVYRVQNGYELDELHDVTTINYTTPQDEDSVLILDSTQELWKRLTLFNLYTYVKTYFDTIYQSVITPGTTSQYFRGDKTFQTLDKTAVGLSNVDNTSDANKPVSTAQATAIAAKQDILVSATNIKTINGSSVLGSGNLTVGGSVSANYPLTALSGTISIPLADEFTDGYLSSGDWALFDAKQPALISGGNIKTINGNSVLGSGDLTISSSGLQGVHNLLGNQISTSFGIMPGLNASSLTNFSQTAGSLYLLPFIPNKTITSVSLKINIVISGVGAIARILIYSDLNGFPRSVLYQSSNLDCSTTGIKSATTAFTFNAGTTYWLAVQVGTANITLNGITTGALAPIFNFGFANPYTGYYTAGLTIGTPPNPYALYSYYNTAAPAIFISLS